MMDELLCICVIYIVWILNGEIQRKFIFKKFREIFMNILNILMVYIDSGNYNIYGFQNGLL